MRTLLFFLCLVSIVCWAVYARMVLSEQAYDAQHTGVRWSSYNKTDKEFFNGSYMLAHYCLCIEISSLGLAVYLWLKQKKCRHQHVGYHWIAP